MRQGEVEQWLEEGRAFNGVKIRDVSIRNKSFDKPISFSSVDFTGDVTFDNVTFLAGASFNLSRFRGSCAFRYCRFNHANFFGTEFHTIANFTGAKFTTAYFWRSFFRGPVKFHEVEVKKDGVQDGFVFPGETNFSFALFQDRVEFFRARFYGPGYFIGTRFKGGACFREAKFFESATFEGRNRWICMLRSDFTNLIKGNWKELSDGSGDAPSVELASKLDDRSQGTFTRLLTKGVIAKSAEIVGDAALPFVDIADYVDKRTDDYARRLADLGFSTEEIRIFEAERAIFIGPMFPRESVSHFDRVVVENGKKVRIANCDLKSCSFAGASLKGFEFENVAWDEQRMIFWKRAALFDERLASSSSDYNDLYDKYVQLKTYFLPDSKESEDFYVGAREMQRRKGTYWLAFNKYISAYNTSVLLAFFWVAVFVLVLFPAIYIQIDAADSFSDAVLYSLSLSSFFKEKVEPAASVSSKIVHVIEVIVVVIILVPIASFTLKRRLHI